MEKFVHDVAPTVRAERGDACSFSAVQFGRTTIDETRQAVRFSPAFGAAPVVVAGVPTEQ
eukprot:gene11018-biopygen1103